MTADEEKFKIEAYGVAMLHFQAQYKSDIEDATRRRIDRISEILDKTDKAWCKKNEPTWFDKIGENTTLDWVKPSAKASKKTESKERWKPKLDEWYWTIRATGNPLVSQWHESKLDMDYWAFGNVFPTEKAAIEARDKIKNLLINL